MPSFLKNPKFIFGTLVVLWVAYVIYYNLDTSVEFRLLPFRILVLQLRVSAIVAGAAVFGSLATLVIQFFWNRRSKNGSPPASAISSAVP